MANIQRLLREAEKFDLFKLKNRKTGVFIQFYTQDCIQLRIKEDNFYLFYDLKNGETCNRYYHQYDIVSKINN